MNKDSIKIKIIFNGKNLTVDVPKNKPFKILREKVHAFFYPLPQNYAFFEKKEDLTTVEDKLLGDIFGARNLIILTLKEINSNSINAKSVNNQKNFVKNVLPKIKVPMKYRIIAEIVIHLYVKAVD